MRVIIALLIASALFTSTAFAALPAIQTPPRRTGALVLPIAQLRTMFPNSGTPMEILNSGIQSGEGQGTSAPTASTSSPTAPISTGTATKEGSPAYGTGAGVALTASALADPATSSRAMIYQCIVTSTGVMLSPDGAVCSYIPSIAPGSTAPLISAAFYQLPQSRHLYLLTLKGYVLGSFTQNVKLSVGGQQVAATDLKINGDTVGVLFAYDASADQRNPGILSVFANWTGGADAHSFFFYSMQLVRLD